MIRLIDSSLKSPLTATLLIIRDVPSQLIGNNLLPNFYSLLKNHALSTYNILIKASITGTYAVSSHIVDIHYIIQCNLHPCAS